VAQVFEQVERTIEQHSLLTRGETVIVGVSGGPDSLCLLHCLVQLVGEYNLVLHVAHLHHGLRGEEAEADADFVQALAEEWDLPCTVERASVPDIAREQSLAIEEAARRARYGFLSGVAVSVGAQTIAVGHNADDQAETVLMHFVRGSGLAGLRGMLPSTPLAHYRIYDSDAPRTQPPATGLQSPGANLHLIRPLLEVTRDEVESYCDHHHLKPRFDRSNLDTTYFRNWLRYEVLPLLCQHNPNVRVVMRRSARVIADEYALLRSLLAETWPDVVVEEVTHVEGTATGGDRRIVFDLAAWRALPVALQRSTLREAIHRLRRTLRNINFVHVEDAVRVALHGTTGDQATLPRGLILTVGYDRFAITDLEGVQPIPDWPLLPAGSPELPVLKPGDTHLPGSAWVLKARLVARDELPLGWDANPDPWLAYLDARAVAGHLVLRPRRPGDRFQPLGLGGHTVKLADFYTNQKVPRAARDRLPLLVVEDSVSDVGRITWVCGWRVDERARVRAETEQVLVLRFRTRPCRLGISSVV
jgi:tRNA(Ile)-lysidine synthase